MFNLLPETEKKNIVKEYAARRMIVGLGFVSVLGIITAISLLPTYIITSAKVAETTTEIESIRKSPEFSEAEVLEKNLSQAEIKVGLLNETTHTSIEVAVEKVLSVKTQPIRISGFQYKKGSGKDKSLLVVQGIARDRESLSQFVKSLQGVQGFDTANLPVSNLAKDRNAEFSIEIRGSF